MKMDINLIRKILKSYREPVTVDKSDNIRVIEYHIHLCDDAGFVEYNMLTTKGIEFLNTFPDDDIWNKTLETMREKGFEGLPVEVLEKLYKKVESSMKTHIISV